MHLSPLRSPLTTLGAFAALSLALSACADPLAPTAGVESVRPSLDVEAAATIELASGTATVWVCPEADAFTTSTANCEPAFNVDQNPRWNIIPGTSWISNEPDGDNDYSVAQQFYWYKVVFPLPTTDGASLSFDLFADNAATLYLNGSQFGAHANQSDYYPNYGCLGSDPVTCSGFTGPTTFGTASGFVTGANVFTIKALNATFVQGCEEAQADPETCDSATGLNFAGTVTFIPELGDEGCTPGYWKQSQHFDSWPAGIDPTDVISDYFAGAGPMANTSLIDALNGGGGGGVDGARSILLRAAVAALLNSASTGVDYTMTSGDVIAAVNTALASGNRDTMLALAAELDADNNGGCPLD